MCLQMNKQTWKKHYNEEVRIMNARYEKINEEIPTIKREITPEEQRQYEQAIDRATNKNNPYKLSFSFNT